MSQHTTGIQRTATQRVPTRTVAGSYEAPVEGIVDYGAFQRGFESTFEMPEIEKEIELKGLKKVFDGGAGGNKLTDGEDIYDDVLGNDLLRTWTKDNSGKFIKSDTEGQKNYLEKVQKVQKSINNKGSLFGNIGDHQLNDTNFNFNFIDENGKGIPGLTPAVINRIHGDPSFAKNRRIDTKDVIVDGRKVGEKAGEYMTISVPDPTGKGGLLKMKEKEIFINYEDMDENWQGNTFQLNYGHEASLSDNKPEGFENKVVAGQMLEKKYDQTTVVGGKTVDAGSTRNVISDDWYNDTESKMNLAVDKVFNFDQGVMGGGYESAFRQFREQDFQLNPNTIKMLKDAGVDIDRASQITDEMAANIPDAEKVNMLRDWWVQSSLITNASIGYDRGENGRAIENNVKIDRRYKEQPFDEDIDDDGSGSGSDSDKVKGRLFNITSNLNNSVYNFSTPGQSNYLKGNGYKDVNVKELTGGYFADIDGTKATLTSGRVVRDGNNMFLEIKYDVGRSAADGGKKVVDSMNEKFPIARIEKDENGKEKAVTDFAGRKRFTERIYKAQFGSSTADTATDLLTGDDTVYGDRTIVQDVFGKAGKDETMFRRIDIINKFSKIDSWRDDIEAWSVIKDMFTPEDRKLLKDPSNESELAKEYQKFLRR